MLIHVLLYVTLGLFALGQLGRVSFFNQEINIYLYEIPLAITMCILFFRYRTAPIKASYKKVPFVFWYILFSLFSFLFSLLSYSLFRSLIAFFYFMRLCMYLGYGVYLSYFLKKERHSRRAFTNAIFLFFIITIASSFLQYFLYPDLRNLIYQGWDPHLNRMFGVFFDTSVAAAVYGLSFLFILIIKSMNYFLPLFLISFVLTFARSSYIGFFISLFSFFIAKHKLYYVFIFAALFIFLLVLLPKQFGPGVGLARTFSIESRLSDYKEAVQFWSKNSLFGIGYNRIKRNAPSHASASFSSSYLIILVTGGVIGLLLFAASVIQLALNNKKGISLFIFIGILSFFDNILLHPFILFLLGNFLIRLSLPSDRSRK